MARHLLRPPAPGVPPRPKALHVTGGAINCDPRLCGISGVTGTPYTIRAGDASIVTGTVFSQTALASGDTYGGQRLYFGPPSSPCTTQAAAAIDGTTATTSPQQFVPRIAIPGEIEVAMIAINSLNTHLFVIGYLVPVGSVPARSVSPAHDQGALTLPWR
jgi:hypothetical protein